MQQKLSAHQTHQYKFTLPAGQHTRLSLVHLGGQLQGTLSNKRNQSVVAFACLQSCQISRSVVASGESEFQLTLRSLDTAAGEYQLKIDDLRAAAPADQFRIAAEAAQAEGQKLLREGQAEKSQQAIRKYRAAQALWNQIGEPHEAAQALREIGGVYLALGQLEQAITCYEDALNQSKVSHDLRGEIEANNNLGEVYLLQDDAVNARKYIELALALSEKAGDQRAQALVKANLGEVEAYSNSEHALSLCQEVMQFWLTSGERENQAKTLLKIGMIHYYAGEYAKAIASYQQALALSRALKTRGVETTALAFLGHIHSMIGEKQKALEYYQTAQQVVVVTGDRIREANLLSGIGFYYDELGDKKRALEFRAQSLQIYQELKAKKRAMLAQIYIGELQTALGNYPAARQCFEEVLQQLTDLKAARLYPWVLHDQGLLWEAQGQRKQALFYYKKALALNRADVNERWQAYVWTNIGRIYHHFGRWTQAALAYRQALALNQKANDQMGQSQTYYYLAKLEQKNHHLPAAQAWSQQSAVLLESLRGKIISPALRMSYFASVNQIFELYIDILLQQQHRSPHKNFVPEALAINEQSRSRTLLDSLNESHYNIKQGVDPRLLEQERTLQQTRNGKADRKMQLAGNKDNAAELAAITKEVDDLSSQLDDIRSKIRSTSPRYAALTQPQPLKAAEIQQLLDDDTLLLEYALGEERSYLWAVTNHSIDAYTLPNRATIEPLVREVYQLMTAQPNQESETAAQWHSRVSKANEQYWPRAAELSQMILGPVAAKLGNKRLVVVGDGALQLLPFAALPAPRRGIELRVSSSGFRGGSQTAKPATQNPQPLITDHEITSLPSASSLKLLREDRVKTAPPTGLLAQWTRSLRLWFGRENKQAALHSVAVLADPVFEKDDKRVLGKEPHAAQANQRQTRDVDLSNKDVPLPRLIATREEAEEIQKVAGANAFLLKHGFAVNRSLLEGDELNRYGVVHFATHGFWDSVNPELSGIFLSRFDRQGNPLDGALRLSDIYNLRLPKELVVLSACETALGKDIRGEGLIALTRGFMYAGAARVMASLWKVDDDATAEIMKIFYQHLLQGNLSPAAALRQAQIAMWQKEPTTVPYNWAAFVLQGEYR